MTRDRKVVDAEWQGREFQVVDTGGWLPGGTALDAKVSRQSERAMADASVVLFLVDSRTGRPRRTPRSPTCCAGWASRCWWW